MSANGLVTTFVRLHPLLPVPLDALDTAGDVIHRGETVSVDLTLSLEETWHETRRDHHNHINRARRAGVEVVFDDWERLDEWVTIYHENMQRLDASKFYFFPREHLTALHEAVGDRMHLAVAIVNGDERGGLGGPAGASRDDARVRRHLRLLPVVPLARLDPAKPDS